MLKSLFSLLHIILYIFLLCDYIIFLTKFLVLIDVFNLIGISDFMHFCAVSATPVDIIGLLLAAF